ncbi:hypothetical protein [Ferdinandcohnia sp. SAFN-114]|uniref:hypothetical protein n=1 Tax=Ferdinandcohnia sp. SAFN-114 TaxID=3387275 RepID=UPI003F7CFD61
MNSTFWSSTIWYVLLGITTFLELVIILIKVKDRKHVISLFLTISGITFICFEMAILMCFKAYVYYPKIFSNQHDDSVVGNLFSQFSVTSSAILITLLNLRFYWYFLIAAVYAVIEELFVHLGIYKQNWYQTWMTFIGLLSLFWITKRINHIMLKNFGRVWRYLFIFLGLCTLHLHTITWAFKVIGIRKLNECLLTDNDCSIVVIAGIYMLVLGIISLIIYFTNIKWTWKIGGICILYLAHYIAEQYQLLMSAKGSFFISTTISIWGMFLYIFILDWLYPKS